jgi:hypothetical protein
MHLRSVRYMDRDTVSRRLARRISLRNPTPGLVTLMFERLRHIVRIVF